MNLSWVSDQTVEVTDISGVPTFTEMIIPLK
jgi:hypothetical protein